MMPVSVAKWLWAFLQPLEGMLVHRRSLPRNSPVPIYTPGNVRVELSSCPSTQHNVPSQGPNPDRSLREQTHYHLATEPPTYFHPETKQMFSFLNTCPRNCVWQKNHLIVVMSSFWKNLVFKMLFLELERKACVFKFLQLKKCFRKALSGRITVGGRPNRKNRPIW